MTTLDLLAQAAQSAQADADALQAAEAVVLAQRDTIAELDAQAAAQLATIANQGVRIDGLLAVAEQARITIEIQDQTITAQAARIAELEDLLNGGGGDPPPTGRTRPLLIGGTVDRRNGQTWETALDQFAADLNVPGLDMTRRFFSNLPTNLATQSVIVTDRDRCHSWVSFKSETATANQVAATLRTLPQRDGLIYLVALHHEPDNDVKQGMPSHTPAWFQGRLMALGGGVDMVRAEGRTDIRKTFVVTGWLDNDTTPGDSSPWFPTDPTGWVCGIDPYGDDLVDIIDNSVQVWKAHGGKEWAVAEIGCQLTGQALANQITASIAYCDADPDCLTWLWFHSAVNGPWWLDDPAGRAALGAAIRANRARWADHPLISSLPN